MALTQSWHTMQLDFVLVFPQAPVERETREFEVDGGKNEDYVLQIRKNIYGQKQVGRVWNQYLVKKLKKIGFVQSKIDECVFYRGRVMYVLYTDDSILAGPDKKELDKVVKDMKQAKLDITVEGDLADFLGINISREKDGTIHLLQPHLIEQIMEQLQITDKGVKTKNILMKSSTLLSRHSDSPDFDKNFHYRSVIGKLNYLEKGSRPDISHATHQCVWFCEDPKKEHGDAVHWLGRYLKGNKDKGIKFKPDTSRSLEVFVDVDVDVAGNWDKTIAAKDQATA
jgi:hypothetical protein